MAFRRFPHQQYFRILETDVNTKLGYFNLQDATELKHMMITIYVQGIIPSAFDLVCNIYGDAESFFPPIFSSEPATISVETLSPTYDENWIGNIYLDFAGYPLNPNINYYMSFETTGYTRNADIFYVGINLDWYSPVNEQLTPDEAGARIRILGKR